LQESGFLNTKFGIITATPKDFVYMAHKSDEIWGVIGRYFDNSMTGRDEAVLKQWLEEDKENDQILEFMKELQENNSDENDKKFFRNLNSDQDWAAISSHIRRERSKENQQKIHQLQRERKKQQRFFTLLKVAALLLVGLTSLYLTMEYVYTPSLEAEKQEMAILEEVSTNRGERANITLGDGTKVSLNVDSKILIPRQFGDNQRKVILEGEAFFDVTEDPGRPFLIEAGGSVTEVLGTSFGVRSYQSDKEVQVVVKSGTVALHKIDFLPNEVEYRDERHGAIDSGDRILLQAGETGIFRKDDLSLSSGIAGDPDELLGWMQSRLIFREASLEEIFATLERWFDVTISTELNNLAMSENQITLNMRKGDIRDVLELLSESVNIRYEFLEDEHIVIR
jgi:transmembrane sensor